MWKPPERIKYKPLTDNWPSREAAAVSRLFSPVSLGPTRLEERTWIPAMVPWRASDDGVVTEEVLDWYGRFARGRPGAIVVEATGIRDVPSGPLLRIGHDRFLPGLRELVERVRQESDGHHPPPDPDHRFPGHPAPAAPGQIPDALPAGQ